MTGWKGFRARLLWVAAALVPWVLAWGLLGIRALRILKETPNPFLRGVPMHGPILQAARNWALESLLVQLGVALVLVFLAQVWSLVGAKTHEQTPPHWRSGLWTGLGTLLAFHGILYAQTPMALHSLHGIRNLPIGLAILLFLGGGWLAFRFAFRASHGRGVHLRVAGLMLTLVGVASLPHDLFRRLRPADPLPRETPRLLVVGIDGLARDAAARVLPEWDLPPGVHAVPPVPATRKAWLSLFGADPAYAMNAVVIPSVKELQDPNNLALVREAGRHGIRTGWAINDPTTLSFGMLTNAFAELHEPPGGWTYWFMLGFGTLWPVNTWAQNYLSPVETTNTWSDRDAFFRDVGRLLEQNQWVSAHDVELHIPIVLQWRELNDLEGGWRWLLKPATVYRVYQTAEHAQLDQGRNASWRNDGERHYQARVGRALRDLRGWVETWNRTYPNLSGVVTSDHGEYHAPVFDPNGKMLTKLAGMHGFTADPATLWIPLYPFGKARFAAERPQTVSWFNLRDAIQGWVHQPGELVVGGTPKGWMISFPTVDNSAVLGAEPKAASTPGGSAPAADRGLKVKDIASRVLLDARGFWFLENLDVEQMSKGVRSTALVTGAGMVTFNPDGKGGFTRSAFDLYTPKGASTVTKAEVEAEVGRFPGSHPAALAAGVK